VVLVYGRGTASYKGALLPFLFKIMLKFFEPYVLYARVFPAILISLPFIITWYSFSPLLDDSMFLKIGDYGVIIIVLIVLMSNLVRFFGKRIEPELWKKWDGAPSTRFLRKEDKHIASEVKQKLYKKIYEETGIDLEKESSDDKIIQAFSIARNILRKKDKNGLWRKFNKEYGFARNLLGSRWFWFIAAFILALLCLLAFKYFPEKNNALIIGAILNIIICFAAIICGLFVLPVLTKGIAERYAEDALISYYNLD